ncbi:MAG TPA: response regulator [Chitinispirillaceae bacterium]|nr:response regulator [Chitinispirillaceae bacterium]
MNILCVDDDPVYLLVLRTTLARFNRIDTIRFTDTGEKALEIISNEKIDCLLTDLNLPGISGLDLLKKLREVNEYSEVLVISGLATLNQAIDAMKSGACDFLLKPLNPTLICEKINAIRDNLEKKQKIESPVKVVPIVSNQEHQNAVLKEALTDILKIIDAEKIEPNEKIKTVRSILSRTLLVNDY